MKINSDKKVIHTGQIKNKSHIAQKKDIEEKKDTKIKDTSHISLVFCYYFDLEKGQIY